MLAIKKDPNKEILCLRFLRIGSEYGITNVLIATTWTFLNISVVCFLKFTIKFSKVFCSLKTNSILTAYFSVKCLALKHPAYWFSLRRIVCERKYRDRSPYYLNQFVQSTLTTVLTCNGNRTIVIEFSPRKSI